VVAGQKIEKRYIKPEPSVSVIIAARNEERNLYNRLQNLVKQDYPANKLEIIVISDGSTDQTQKVAESFIVDYQAQNLDSGHIANIKLIVVEESMGKPHALNLAVRQSKGELLLFTDARQWFESSAIRELVANFNDSSVGSVSGELVFADDNHQSIREEMNIYWNLEKSIRKMESAIESVAGATGAIYAIRRELFVPIPLESLLDDLYVPMMVVLQGYRNVFDSGAVAYDRASKDLRQEKMRKIRTLLGNYQILHQLPWLLSPIKNPIFFRYLSHKLLRLIIPFFYIILMVTSFMVEGFFYKIVLILSIILILLAFTKNMFSSIPFFGSLSKFARTFVIFNYFAVIAFIYYIFPINRKIW